jgi:hypothetical protein
MDTIGNIIDKLFTVNLKLKNNNNPDRLKNLNIQKDLLKSEIDNNIGNIMSATGLNDDDVIRPQHKTY